MSEPTVSVILRTLATAERGDLLLRAIDSILQGQDGTALPIVVVNGSRYDPALVVRLKAREDIQLLQIAEAGLQAANLAARHILRTPFFAFFDDDDELLPDAIPTRLAPLLADPTLDIVVTNGYIDHGTHETIQYPDFPGMAADPLRGLIPECWLQSVNALYRSRALSEAELAAAPSCFEWTYLALRLATTRKILFLDQPTYRLNRRTTQTMSYSMDFILAQPAALNAMLMLDLPPDVRRALKVKLSSSFHTISSEAIAQGQRALAWRTHLKSLFIADGWRWIPYTRRLLQSGTRSA